MTVVDDYAHHPTEVSAALAAGRGWLEGQGRLIAVFQPHLYSRTKHFYSEFAAALGAADGVILAPIYPAREEPISGVTSKLITDGIDKSALSLGYVLSETLDAIPGHVAAMAQPGDLIMTIGAGSIYHTGPAVLSALKETEVNAR
jgi:UDP-N-acetylmuramate--alanine ligase